MTSVPDPLVLVDTPSPGIAVVTLNRPRAMNALSTALRRELVRTFDALGRDDGLRVVVVTGAGKAFCAGLDLKELGGGGDPDRAIVPSADPDRAIVPSADADPVGALRRLPMPTIGAINGVAITGGFELALAADLMIASEAARFADTHARVGILPGWGLSQRLPRLVGEMRARELAFTGRFLDAAQAERWGLVNRVVPAGELLPAALALAREIAETPTAVVRAYKRQIGDGSLEPLGTALALERERSSAWSAANVDAAAIERNRRAVTERGRSISRA